MKHLITLCAALTLSLCLNAAEPLRLLVPEYAPYTSMKEGKAVGIGVEKVTAMLDTLGIPYTISGGSYDVAVDSIKAGTADGFFLASQNKIRDQVAVLFAPIVYNTWNWYLPADSSLDPAAPTFRNSVIVGSVKGSNPASWLNQNNYRVSLVPDAEVLPAMLLNHKGINAVMGPELVINEAIRKAGYDVGKFKVALVEKKPFGIYLSKSWVAKNPELVAKIRDAVAAMKP